MFYTYVWYSEDGVPFYIGKGSGNRFSAYNGRDEAFLKKIKSQKCYVRIDDIFANEADALNRENELIEQYGRIADGGVLFNKSRGSMTSSFEAGTLEAWTKEAIDNAFPKFKKESRPDDLRMLRIDRVLELIPVSRVSLYRMIKAGQFPRPVKLGGSSAWSNHEIRKWRDNLLLSRGIARTMEKKRRERDLSDLV